MSLNAGGIFQPRRYPERDPKDIATFVQVYSVEPTGDHLIDLAATGLLYRVDMPDTSDEVIEITSGRYDGLRYSGVSGAIDRRHKTSEAP